ncbi:hypothetical protein SAY86_003180 [Trapa natans]|uniref:DCD domain-containing protein n=1 Tax=Trapa natans TaxID=22666 RepID=A0AAN7LHI4_TRANT|nr:hypothetical protein SAY86_003180 [Trapa natans]
MGLISTSEARSTRIPTTITTATSFGGSNIDPTAWKDKKVKGESRFPAQEEDTFRPVLHHYDGPKFRPELSFPRYNEYIAIPKSLSRIHYLLMGNLHFLNIF